MTTRTPHRASPRAGLRRLVESDLAAAVAAAVAASLVALALLQEPARVDAVEVTNPTDYDLAIDVRGSSGGWMPLSTAPDHGTVRVREVIDQGERWTFRFRAQGRDAGEVQVDRDSLDAAGWVITVPASAGQVLADAGAPTPP